MSINQHNIGPYELQQRLGGDSTSAYWKAFDKQSGQLAFISIYQVNPEVASTIIPHIQQEARNLITLQHPGIVPILNVYTLPTPDSSSGSVAVVTDYLEAPSLADYIQTTVHAGNLPSSGELIRLLAPIGTAIDYLHQQGIIHGAIRPSNILLDKRGAPDGTPGQPKLIGLGTNGIQSPLTLSLTDSAYISPERIQGYTENERSDLYSLGVILYELCTGTLPFQCDTPADMMMQHLHTQPTSPALINPRLLPALTAVILRSLAKDPVARFHTASAMLVAIARAFNMSSQDVLGQSGINLGMSGPMWAISNSGPIQQLSTASLSAPARSNPSGPIQVPPIVASSNTPILNLTFSGAMPAIEQKLPILRASQPYTAQPPADQTTNYTPSTTPPVAPKGPANNRSWLITSVIIAIAILLVAGSVGAYFFFLPHGNALTSNTTLVGHAFYVSSGQVTQNTTQGVADKLQIDLQGLPHPSANKSYYLWLLSDSNFQGGNTPAIPVGTSANGGPVKITFSGDQSHSDLLAHYSRFLITEEDNGTPPISPSLDRTTWRYYAEFSQTPNPADTQNHFSLLDHFRHLLSQDPKLRAVGLSGGLDTWLFNNTLKILEWSGSARDAQSSADTGLIRRQAARILDYLDGTQYIQTENIPPDLQGVLTDPTLSSVARVAMLTIDVQNQSPPGYLLHIGNHLREVTQTPGVTADQKALAILINTALNNVQASLNNVHLDAEKLIHMTPNQLLQSDARKILDDMFTQANNAFVGQTDPNTHQVKEGVVQIHYNIQRLVTFNVQAYQPL